MQPTERTLAVTGSTGRRYFIAVRQAFAAGWQPNAMLLASPDAAP
ncbi:hypothetical protein SAMN05216252_121125 [Actinacidiphila glaucinigra]|uniref:Uncharacterized protein n=1 Tax=Actinacidiphila glaucinigra TaxID=235986 RepID=A0A239LX49_9ACTN|nr:hypothetical protein SAMN05216252_121125 [Actinacidiphila glaucinigra]